MFKQWNKGKALSKAAVSCLELNVLHTGRKYLCSAVVELLVQKYTAESPAQQAGS